MKFRALIHFKNDEELASMPVGTLEEALANIIVLTQSDEDYDPEDVQFWQVEPVED